MGSSISFITKKFMAKKEMRLLFMGLDAAGKTTILYRLKLGDVVTTIPTIGFNVETVEHKNVHITSWDVGGRDKIRPLWRHYYQNTDAIVFVVDSNDRDRIDDAKEELQRVLAEDEMKDAVLLVFANKQDLPNAMSREEVVEKLGLHELRQTQWCAFASNAPTGAGLYDGLDWLVDTLAKSHTQKSVTEPVVQTMSDAKGLSGRLLGPASQWLKQVSSMSWWSKGGSQSTVTPAA